MKWINIKKEKPQHDLGCISVKCKNNLIGVCVPFLDDWISLNPDIKKSAQITHWKYYECKELNDENKGMD
jgi:hypothetical protein